MSSIELDMRVWRATWGLTQQKAADRLGVSLSTWARWERGEIVPTGGQFMELRNLLSGPPWQFIDFPGPGVRTDIGERDTEQGYGW